MVVFAARPDNAPIRVCAREVNGDARARSYRRALVAALAAAAVFAMSSSALDSWFADQRQTAQAEISRRAAAMRTIVDSSAQDPQLAALLQRKRSIPPAIVILEAVSRALPDDSYLTQLRISGARLEIDGVSRSASSLVALLERTEPFRGAQFLAPTTPAALEGAEAFHIAADIAAARGAAPMTAQTPRPGFRASAAHRRRLLAFGLYAIAALILLGVGTNWLAAAAEDYAWLRDNQDRSRALAERSSTFPPDAAPQRREARCCGRRRSASPPPIFSSGWKPRRTMSARKRFRRASTCRMRPPPTARSPTSAKSSSMRRAFSRCFTISKPERRISKSSSFRSGHRKTRTQADACASRWP